MFGSQQNIINISFYAILPAAIILYYVYKRDKFPEPPRVVLVTLFLGFGITFPLVLLIPFAEGILENLDWDIESNNFYMSFIRASFLEETMKFLILVYYCLHLDEFDEPMDALVYGVAASLGFSALENITYVLNHESYYATWQQMAYIRIFPTIMHGTNGIIMGLLLSKVLFIHRNHTKLILALLIPVLFHGSYNLIITYLPGLGVILLFVFVIYIFILVRRIRKLQANKIMETEIKETISHAIVFQSIFICLVLIVILVAIVVGMN